MLPTGKLTTAQTILSLSDSQILEFQIFSQPEKNQEEEQKWVLHSTGKIRTEPTNKTPKKIDLEKYQRECTQAIEIKKHYQKYQEKGIEYGKSFQGIEKLWSGSNQALAEIRLPAELLAETTDYEYHPALLDAALQIIYHTLPETQSDKTYLPVGIEKFHILGTPGLSLWAHASVKMPVGERRESLTTQVTIANSEGEIIATVKGLQVKLATKETLQGKEVESIKNWLYEVEWRTKGRLGRLLPPDFLLPPVEIASLLTPMVKELITQIDNERISEIGKSLEELSVDYILAGLVSMGWSYKPTEKLEADVAAESLGIVASQRRLFMRLLEILEEEGILKSTLAKKEWEVKQSLSVEVEKVNPNQKSESLRSKYPEEQAKFKLLERCGTQLSGVLTGVIDPVHLVFPQGDLSTATELYEDSTVAKVMNAIVQKTIAQAIEKLPANRSIKLLEIGAGTGGTTSYILPHLNPWQTEYTFTDIGSLFTSKAQEKFGDYQKFMSYQTLDIEVEPSSQGFETNQYDVIIAANVLHATRSIKETLENVRKMLAPGGMLVLYEVNSRQRWVDLVFGLLEGWWKFEDVDLRPDYPLLSRWQWEKVLSETGFTQIVTMPEEVEGMAEELSGQAVIVAQAGQTKVEETESEAKGWLILADQQGIGQKLARQLESVGDKCNLVYTGEKYQQIAPEEFTINPEKVSDFEELIATIGSQTPLLHGVVQCWTTEAGESQTISAQELENLSKQGCGSTLCLVQALIKAKLSQSPRLWLVTSGSQPVPSNHQSITGVAQSSVWGMGKVIDLENPELNCTCIDLDPQESLNSQAKTLFNEIWSEDRENQVGLRGEHRYVPRLVASVEQPRVGEELPRQKPLSFCEDGTYLITGGLGGLGLLVASWMVSRGAKHLVLVTRRSPEDDVSRKLRELEKTGASIVVEKADVSDVAGMKEVLERIEKSKRPLAGVIHSAGMLSDGVLQNQTWSSFAQVMAPKVQGSWNLHKLTEKQPLEFFVVFSSMASLFGSAGQGNHSAANGFMDGLAHYRRGMGLPGLSIHWGAVSQVGEAAERGTDVRATEKGMGVISPHQVLESLELVMSGSEVEVGIVPMHWSAWQERAVQWKFLEDWQAKIETGINETSKSKFILQLEGVEYEERQLLLAAHVRRQVGLVLGINQPESISLETGFFDLGMDSLTSMELRNKLQKSLECSLPSTLAFEYPNIQVLTDYLEEKIIQSLDSTQPEEETEARIDSVDIRDQDLESTEAIAIIGIGCRFPDGVDNPEAYWQFLKDARDVRIDIPKDRWDIERYYDQNPNVPGKIYVRQGYFLKQPIDQFEPEFFGISGAEAARMEPSQRLLLEVTWEALENAGLPPSSLKDTNTGVFIGQMNNDYGITATNSLPENLADFYLGIGTSLSMSAGRVAYFLGLQGPTLCLDTSCSSSLVTLHLACQSLRSRESNLALVGGVNLMLHPNVTHGLCQGKALSPDSRCKVFDASADGFARGEGCGIVVLKRLRDAIADRDRILGLVKGSAVNHDGASSGLTVPNQQSQKKVIVQALKNAKVSPLDIDYVECHGTGTSLGDPLEVRALNEVYCQDRSKEQLLLLGAVKSNIGHLEAAAGIAGVIKIVLAMENQQIPANLHFERPNPQIDWDEMPVQVPTQSLPWVAGEKPRLAGISGFGMSGTNAHVVLQEAPRVVKGEPESDLERSVHILTLSAKTQSALGELIARYQKYLETNQDSELADICYTANTGRTHFKQRLAAVASNKQELAQKLAEYKQGEEVAEIVSGEVTDEIGTPSIAFLFTGQGSQYVNMGKQLYETEPVFREALDKCDRILSSEIECSLLDVLYDESRINQTAYTQPALFAIEYALFQLWSSWGIKPSVVMGHSVGEYVAATVAGVFNLEDGLRLIAARGRLMQQLPGGGEMVSVMASHSKVSSLLEPYKEVAIAAINGPESTVISGNSKEIRAIVSNLESAGIKTKQLQVSHAFHSPLMEPMLAEFENVAKQVNYSQPRIPLISNVSGKQVDLEIATAEYWVNHVRQPVKFAQSMETLDERGYEIFLEIGPKPILLGMGRGCLLDEKSSQLWLSSLRPGKVDSLQMLQSLAQLYVRGLKVDWLEFDKHYPREKVVLPTYAWQRQRYWIETNNTNGKKQQYLPESENLHPLLGRKLYLAGLEQQHRFESQITTSQPPYLSDHHVFEKVIMPGAGYLEMSIAAGLNVSRTSQLVLEDIVFEQSLILSEERLKTVQTILKPLENKAHEFQIFSQQTEENEAQPYWMLHAQGKIQQLKINNTAPTVDLEAYKAKCTQEIDVKEYYQQLKQQGLNFGPNFQGIQKLWLGLNQVLGQIQLPQELVEEALDYQFHPALLDACFQVIGAAVEKNNAESSYLLVGIEKLTVYSHPGINLWAIGSITEFPKDSRESLTGKLTLLRSDGQTVATIEGLQLKQVTAKTLLRNEFESVDNWLYEVEWKTKARFGRNLPPEYLLTPVQIKQQLEPTITELVAQEDLDSYREIPAHLEKLSLEYVVQALLEMKWPYNLGEVFSTESAAQRLGVVSSQLRLFNRMLQMLAEDGIIQQNQHQWQVQEALEEVNPSETSQKLLIQYPSTTAEIDFLNLCATQLSGVLRGEIDPVQLVFPEGDLTTATQLYQESPAAKVMNTIVQQAITKASAGLSKVRGLRLLEIGGGTGGTTSYILPHLKSDKTEYVFTDIGGLFTTKALEKFQEYPFVEYKNMDIEVDPITQGFKSHQYDVIVAANVLHATTSLSQTLSHVRKLLAPGGILVLLEATCRLRWVDLVFGLLEGWWKFQDVDLRPDYPLLSTSKWKQLLGEKGFSEVVALPEMEEVSGMLSQQAVIIAKADETQPELSSSKAQHWLIFADEEGVAQNLATQLRSQGKVCTLVFSGEQYQQIAPEEFIINPYKPEEFERIVAQIAEEPSNLLYGVVQCWSLEAKIGKNISSDELEKLSQLGCGTTLSILQALIKGDLSQPPRLWLVTQGAQPVPQTHPVISGLAQSSVWGLGKAIALEHPELNCVRIDLDPQQSVEKKGETLWSEIWSEDLEDQIAIREEERYVARLVRSHYTQTEKHLSFREDGTYLITGGLGNLGLLVASWMVERGAKHLVLIGRGNPNDTTRNKLSELEKAGAQIVVEQASVSDLKSIMQVLSNIDRSLPSLIGVIHSAGVFEDGVLQNQTWSSFEKVMAPKVQGSWNLHQLTKDLALDLFVCFSSTSSLLGYPPGQGNYDAANAFLDSLAHYRQEIGLPGLSINWGIWEQSSKLLASQDRSRLQGVGIGVIPVQQGLQALEKFLLNKSQTQVGVLPIQWSFGLLKEIESPFLENWRENTQVSLESQPDFLQQLKAAVPSDRQELLTAHIRRQVAQILGTSSQKIDFKQGFFDMGMDSLMAVELRSSLQKSLGCNLPSTLIFKYPTLKALADYLVQEVLVKSDGVVGNLYLNNSEEKLDSSSDFQMEEEEKDQILRKLAEQLEID